MKVGDLVTRTQAVVRDEIGIVLETGVYLGGKNLKIFWSTGMISLMHDAKLDTVSESR